MFRLFRLGLIIASLTLCAYASEEDVEEDVSNTNNDIEDETTTEVEEEEEQPPYDIPTPEDAFFYETFSVPLEELNWVVSEHSEGTFKVGKGPQKASIKSEQGLVLEDEAKRYAISAKFPAEFDPADQDFVLQYEVRFHKQHECGGAYLKVIKGDQEFDQKDFKDGEEYTIMFGPDFCGSTNKVHFIFRHQHKITNEFEEKHLKNPPTIKNDRLTHLYTLVMRKDNTYEIFIDQKSVNKGKLLEDFDPPVNPPKQIDDPDDKKPEDWVDEAKILDPEASKPDDWDEDAPKKIVDESATKPSGWTDDAPLKIADPEAEQPEDWDEEDDGEWEAPVVDNPACSVGCGDWEAPIIDNPDYKGKWIHPKIDNPDFKGVWSPEKIDNPNYFEDPEPHRLSPMIGVGLEIWSMQNHIEFDNIFIDDSLDAAIEFGKATWAKKYAFEKAAHDKESGDSDFFASIMEPLYSFTEYCAENPLVGVVLVLLIILALAVLIWLCYSLCCAEDSTSYDYGHVKREVSDTEDKKDKKDDDDKDNKNDDDDDGDDDGEDDGEDEGEHEPENKKNEEVVESEEKTTEVVEEPEEKTTGVRRRNVPEKKQEEAKKQKKQEEAKATKKPIKKKRSRKDN